ncbi:GM16011 [Drosophila sechellia]|nr:GM16011 [Drosophila sechellia]
MRMWVRMPQAVQLLFAMGLWAMQGHAQLDSEPEAVGAAGAAGGAGAAGPGPPAPRNRIKAEADALMTGDSFNIRHGRSRSHFLHGSTNSSSGGIGSGDGTTRLLLIPPTQLPGVGGTSPAPVTHKIRKLHKKKINESIRKSVDKSLGLRHTPKNHRSLAEAEHLQGRPASEDAEDTALREVMQLADEIELESSFVTAAPTGDPDIGVKQARQFVRDEARRDYQEDDDDTIDDDEELDEEEEEAPVSTTIKSKIASTRLLPVNGTWQRMGTMTRDSQSESDYDTNALDIAEEEEEGQPLGKLLPLNESLATTEWMDDGAQREPEAEARSQAASMEVKQISFDSDGDSDSDAGLDTSEVTMDDGYPPDAQVDDKTKQLVIGDVEEDSGDNMESNQFTADVINARDSKIDLVSKFLQYIEQQHLMGSNCVAGTSLNLGEGVVDRYAQDRFRVEAEVAVNRANMLTR